MVNHMFIKIEYIKKRITFPFNQVKYNGKKNWWNWKAKRRY